MNETALNPPNVSQSTLDEIVRRIVEVAEPEKVILFGSTARGDANPHSDLDFLVVKECENQWDLSSEIRENLYDLRLMVAIDLVVASSQTLERYKDSHPLVYKHALKDGVVVYQDTDRPLDADRPLKEDASFMTQPGRFPPDDPREWLRRARSDLAVARVNVPDADPESLCFLAQQAAEKAIKALLIMRDVEFPFVHNLAELLDLLEAAGETIPQDVRRAGELTRYAVETRYADQVPRPTEQDLAEAVSIAEAVVRWAEGRVSAGGRQGGE